MEILQLFWAFLISNILGYGGGPPSIPLVQKEVVDHYHFITLQQFGDVLAIGNALPGPIATKMAAFIGYQVAGIGGALAALIATVLPSAAAMVLLYKYLSSFKDSPVVKSLTRGVQPVVAVLLAVLAYQFLMASWYKIGGGQTVLLVAASYMALEKVKIHPALVIASALCYGAFFLSAE